MNRKQQRIFTSWEKFVANLEIEPFVIRPVVANSWHRSYRMQVDPLATLKNLCLLSAEQIERRQRRRKNLMDAAMPFTHNLYNFVKGSDTLVCLADDNGIILEVLNDPVMLHNSKHIGYAMGSDWSESRVGTNAIGTALFEKKPLQIAACEHYCQVLHEFTSSAAPIFSPERELLGALGIVSLTQNVHSHTLGMVVAAVKAIENELERQKKAYELLIAYNKVTTAIENMSDGLIAIEGKKITQLNAVGAQILKLTQQTCLGQSVETIFAHNEPFLAALRRGQDLPEKEFFLETNDGPVRFTATLKTIKDYQGQVTGLIAILREINTVHKLVHKMVGAQAAFSFDDIIAKDYRMQEVIKKAKRVARSSSTILLQGDSGTGKEMFAQAIHNYSGRRHGPFIVLNCGAIPRELVESELFGYEDGAFTGAKKGGRPGKFELADGGTIFLDEIGDMPLEIQTSLLRVLQERQVSRIGGQKSITINTRVIAATNKNLAQEVEKQTFRLDLYYRLNVINLWIPKLAERPADIRYLAEHFVKKISQRIGLATPEIHSEFLQCLEQYAWPGNIRELENVIEHALHMVEGNVLESAHLPEKIYRLGVTNSKKLQNAEVEVIKGTLEATSWNISKSAALLGIGRNTLYRKIKQYQLAKSQ